MPEFFLELFSEEIPARMQAHAALALEAYVRKALLVVLTDKPVMAYAGARRIAVAAEVRSTIPQTHHLERGPKVNAPEAAKIGFMRKTGARGDQISGRDGYWFADITTPERQTRDLVAAEMPSLIRAFKWPKSMRWGGSSTLTWVRPLRRIVCLFDGAPVPFDLRLDEDDGHGLVASNLSEGHRFLSPGTFAVTSAAQWAAELRARHVIVDAAERRQIVADGVAALTSERGCTVVEDPGLLDEVAGLVEWPVPLVGRIDAQFMDLPAEVMQVSMRVNQRYFACRNGDGSAAPYFAFAANIEASDGGAAIIAGNERVLRARFSDARHFWDLDRARRLDSRVAALDAIVFHARIGSQGARVARIVALAGHLARHVGAEMHLAQRAALLAKADLTSGMVGEFPELQGVIGGYYARHDGEEGVVAEAVRDHYAPKGLADSVPTAPVTIAVALADKLDTLAQFFAIGETPTGSGDPFALRRAGLGVIRIIRENRLRLRLTPVIVAAGLAEPAALLEFLAERLRVQLRTEGARHDVLAAVLALGLDDDLTRLLARTEAVAALLGTADGTNLLAAAKRAANILRIEEKKDAAPAGDVDAQLLTAPAEQTLARRLDSVVPAVAEAVAAERFAEALTELATLRTPLDDFFAEVTVNDPDPQLRHNRLRLLSRVRAAMSLAADFSKIDG